MLSFFRSRTSSISTVEILTLIAFSILFIAVSMWTIGASSIWFDEAFGSYLIQYSYWDILYYTGMDVHPPLYYWALKTWGLLFGTSDIALRSMSVFFGVITLGLGYGLVRRLFGKKAALYSVALLAISPMFIRYAQEMRMYTMAAAIAIGATYALVVALEKKSKKAWATYGVLLFAGMWTHYLIALVWLSHWVWRAIQTHHKSFKKWRQAFFSREWVGAHVVAVLLFSPWMYWFIHRIIDVQANGFWIPPLSPMTLPNYASSMLFYKNIETVSPWQTIALYVVIVVTAVLAVTVWRSLAKKQRRWYMLFVALAFVPVLLLVILSLPPLESSFIDRYMLPAIVATSLFLGATIALAPKRVARLRVGLIVLLVVSSGIGVATIYSEGNYNKVTKQSSHARQLIELIRTSGGANEPIIADSPWLYYEAAQYSTSRSPVYFIDKYTEYKYGSLEMLRINDTGKIKDLDGFIETGEPFWYIGRPGEREIAPPAGNVTATQSIRINDKVSGKEAYQAVRYVFEGHPLSRNDTK